LDWSARSAIENTVELGTGRAWEGEIAARAHRCIGGLGTTGTFSFSSGINRCYRDYPTLPNTFGFPKAFNNSNSWIMGVLWTTIVGFTRFSGVPHRQKVASSHDAAVAATAATERCISPLPRVHCRSSSRTAQGSTYFYWIGQCMSSPAHFRGVLTHHDHPYIVYLI
jgi:hypothetical protein